MACHIADSTPLLHTSAPHRLGRPTLLDRNPHFRRYMLAVAAVILGGALTLSLTLSLIQTWTERKVSPPPPIKQLAEPAPGGPKSSLFEAALWRRATAKLASKLHK